MKMDLYWVNLYKLIIPSRRLITDDNSDNIFIVGGTKRGAQENPD